MPDETKLVEAAMVIRGASPEDWDRFVMALREHAAAATRDMLRASSDELVRQQGYALALTQLAMQMHKAPETYQKYLERVRNGRQPRADSRGEVWPEAAETDSRSG
jgi:hypothetical protein